MKKVMYYLSISFLILGLILLGHEKYKPKNKILSQEVYSDAINDPDSVDYDDLRRDQGLDEPILVKKGESFWYQTIPESIPSVLIKYSRTEEGLDKADWVREDGENVKLGVIAKENTYIDFKLRNDSPLTSARIKISIKKKE